MYEREPAYFPAIDGLRALAVAAVLLFHAGHLGGGFLGVDTFFVISGFLITGLLVREIERTGSVRLGEFWARRARRLLPALAVMLCAVTLWSLHWGAPAERLSLRGDTLWGVSFLMNWHEVAAAHDYWSAFALQSPLTHLWSLAVEEQFYLVWPLVALAVVRWAPRPQRALLGMCVAGAAASFMLMAALYDPAASTRAYEGTDTRIGAILIGGLCATPAVRRGAARLANTWSRTTARLIGMGVAVAAGGILWAYVGAQGNAAVLYDGGFLMFALAVGVVILAVTTVGPATAPHALPAVQSISRLLSLGALRSIGRLSYGLYLWHWPIFLALSPARTGLGEWPLLFVRLSVTWIVACASYYIVERPARLGLQRLPRWVTAPATGLAVGVAALIGVTVALPNAGAAAINVDLLASSIKPASTVPTHPSSPQGTASPDTLAGPEPSVATTQGIGTPTTSIVPAPLPRWGKVDRALFLGDSIAYTTGPGIVAAFAAAGITVKVGAFPGVGLVVHPELHEFTRITKLIDETHPQLVIMQLSAWDASFGEAQQYDALTLLHQVVLDRRAKLVIIPVPPLRADQDHGGYDALSAAARHAASSWPADVVFLDSHEVWGNQYKADINGDHVPERMYDGVHICASGAALEGAWLINAVGQLFTGVTPAPIMAWATGDWTSDPIYDSPPGTCAPV